MRVLGLDVGDRRIGIAVSDPGRIIAGALETYTRTSLSRDIAHIAEICAAQEVGEIACGLPRHMNGTEGEQAAKTRAFIRALRQESDIDVYFVDERGTTKRAQGALISSNMRRSKRKQTVDRVAAVIILQDFLDGMRGEKAE